MENKGVYFILSGDADCVKIGFSENIKKRLSGLQSASPSKLVLIAVAKGGPEQERAIHARFKKFNLSGEWFEYSREIQSFLLEFAETYHLTASDFQFLKFMRSMSIGDFNKAVTNYTKRTGRPREEILAAYKELSTI